MGKNVIAAFSFSLYLLSSATAIEAAPIGPVNIPPGGFSFTLSGDTGIGIGQDTTYFNFDFSAFNQLWFGIGNVGSAMDGAVDSLGESMSLISMSSKVAIWSGTTTINTTTGLRNVDTLFTATITGLTRHNWLDPVPLQIDPSVTNIVTEIKSNKLTDNTLSLNFLYEARFDGEVEYTPFKEFFNTNSNASEIQNVRLTHDRRFYYTVVPVPATFWLFGSGLLGLIGIARRKKQNG